MENLTHILFRADFRETRNSGRLKSTSATNLVDRNNSLNLDFVDDNTTEGKGFLNNQTANSLRSKTDLTHLNLILIHLMLGVIFDWTGVVTDLRLA